MCLARSSWEASRAAEIAKAFEHHSFAKRRVGGGVRGGVERVAGLEDGARGDAE